MEKIAKEQDLIAIWQTCVEMANSVSQRRDTMNNLFVILNIALISAISWMWDFKTVVLCIIGFVFCIVWLFYINNFRKLNAAKFQVIFNLEQQFATTPFKDEWEVLCNTKKYINGTTLERFLPIVFMVSYLVLIIFIICTK